jgi:hypothetical protein
MDQKSSGTGGGELFGNTEGVKSKASEAGDKAAEKAREVGHQVEEAAMSKAEEGRHRVADEVHKVSEALRTGARELREGEDDRTTDFIERLAEPVERVSRYLEQHDTRELASDLEDFARRNQAVFLGGAFALGMMGARFLKASSDSRGGRGYGSDYDDYERQRGGALTRTDRDYGPSSYGAGAPRTPRPPSTGLDSSR